MRFSLKVLHEFIRRIRSLSTRFRDSAGEISVFAGRAEPWEEEGSAAGIVATMNCSLSATYRQE
jgi:hypothetical protein